MPEDFDKRAEELARKSERLLSNMEKERSADDGSKKNKESASSAYQDAIKTAREFNENVSWLRRTGQSCAAFFKKAAAFITAIWMKLGPIRRLFGPTLRFIGRTYMRFFRWAAYRDGANGDREISNPRLVLVILITAAIPFAVWYGTRPVFITLQQGVMALFSEKEAYTYFHGSETIEEGKLYTIKTTSGVPASPESTTHMQVQQDIIYWIWFPEDLANAVPNEVAWGRVKYTGWRVKLLNWYPEVKDIEAIPISELPDDHPAKSGNYYISNQTIKEARKKGETLPGTNLTQALERSK